MADLHLTERALEDLAHIERYSTDAWGAETAHRHLKELSAALSRLQEHPDLLVERPEFSGRLRFHAAGKHLLVCDRFADRIYVLAIWHGSMNLIERLERLEPTLLQECDLLARKVDEALP